ncbi:MAG: amidohydrolase family protein [Acidimicrobiia bacterium]
MHDLIIKGGTVVDGVGSEPITADVAVTDGIITEVGRVDGPAQRTISADGLTVMPGIVDIHTHFDGQITWDPLLTPSCWHGVTTVVMGNCGVGFAPVIPERREWLIGLMEGVEDIPGSALSEGIRWSWETYPEYLDAVEHASKALDVGSFIPHGAVRAYVMGERGAKNEPATAEDIAAMAEIVRAGMLAGGLGFSTSRTIAHMAIDGEPVPGTFAARDELFGIGSVLGELNAGVFELAPAGALGEDLAAPDREMAWMRDLAEAIKRPVMFALLQNDHDPDAWSKMLDLCAEAQAEGIPIYPQVAGRPINLLLGLGTFHPFAYCPSWGMLGLAPIEEKVARMGDPAFRATLLAEAEQIDPTFAQFLEPSGVYVMGTEPSYEPAAADSIAARARSNGCSPMEEFYDRLLDEQGHAFLMRPLLNFSDGNLDAVRTMLAHPATVWGLGDGGAHCGTTCDASVPTTMLMHWARDRAEGIALEEIVRKMTSATADLMGLGDRGRLMPGAIADVNLVDLEGLRMDRPELVHDLPGGAKRFVQRSHGWKMTIKSGDVFMEDGIDTGVRNGMLLRGARS